jgi:hypothetical protein
MDETRIRKLKQVVEANNNYAIRMSESLASMRASKRAAEQRQINRCNTYTSHVETLIAALESGITEDIKRADDNMESFLKVMQTAAILGA